MLWILADSVSLSFVTRFAGVISRRRRRGCWSVEGMERGQVVVCLAQFGLKDLIIDLCEKSTHCQSLFTCHTFRLAYGNSRVC